MLIRTLTISLTKHLRTFSEKLIQTSLLSADVQSAHLIFGKANYLKKTIHFQLRHLFFYFSNNQWKGNFLFCASARSSDHYQPQRSSLQTFCTHRNSHHQHHTHQVLNSFSSVGHLTLISRCARFKLQNSFTKSYYTYPHSSNSVLLSDAFARVSFSV